MLLHLGGHAHRPLDLQVLVFGAADEVTGHCRAGTQIRQGSDNGAVTVSRMPAGLRDLMPYCAEERPALSGCSGAGQTVVLDKLAVAGALLTATIKQVLILAAAQHAQDTCISSTKHVKGEGDRDAARC